MKGRQGYEAVLGGVGVCEELGSRSHCTLKYIIHGFTKCKLVLSGGGDVRGVSLTL